MSSRPGIHQVARIGPPRPGTRVRSCKDNLGVSRFDDAVDDVIGFTNQDYYQLQDISISAG